MRMAVQALIGIIKSMTPRPPKTDGPRVVYKKYRDTKKRV